MREALYLAVAYLRFHRWRTSVLVVALALILSVPILTRMVLTASEAQLSARAAATPLMVGARGSALDLMMNGLYFTDDRPEMISMAESERVWDSDLAISVPLHVLYRAGGEPIVGTTLDYFDFRGLEIAKGRGLTVLGEAVLGANAAARLGVAPGETLISDPENLFDLTGAYPLEMTVVGHLKPTQTADDDAIFVDLKTAWVIQGLGHGHNDVVEEGMAVESDAPGITANAALTQFTRITPRNIDTFHFHGAPETYPISAVIAVPPDARNAAILRGRYLAADEQAQIVVPETVVEGLLATVFRIGAILDGVYLIVGLATLLAIALAFFLSLRLRDAEMRTAFHLGCHRFTVMRLLAAEIGIIVIAAGLLALTFLSAMSVVTNDLAIWILTSAD